MAWWQTVLVQNLRPDWCHELPRKVTRCGNIGVHDTIEGKVFALEMGIDDFHGDTNWCYCLMYRHDLILCQKKCLSQRPLDEYEDEILAFHTSVTHL